ncbi:chemotaxis-specific protein-glutamate methyltransferase CheB [Fimbriiglobus ruber]|uniref:Protein-glutamate methylesterase/protein-glutamine glutaminase n=1 Tax=Fimbriiglobus ruber TaxID=1908690 RepID=A0A225CZG0_9BACT|nr:chemotaxis-specific protein-glutamate methyltransferase CheB [Fimbriiglobus ruber]OWK34731.1 Chemotaxis response regulator protein-glutamate methylesterase CheB [Fimbriiglobus ruber]
MRIAIVDDRLLAVEAVRRVVTGVPGYQIAWVARDGEEAVRRATADRPDVILMDLIMPGLNGAEATRRIMATNPCPILIVTATVSGNYGLVYEALGAGAVDAVNTPVLGGAGAAYGADALLAKIAQVARKARPDGGARARPSFPCTKPAQSLPPLVAIGASTGGPQAIASVLAQFPPGFPAAVLVVQHLTAEFSSGFAEWLGQKTRLPIRLARAGEPPQPGTALVTGKDDHLVVTPDGTLTYTAHPTDTPFRPNVDVLFDSLAAHWPAPGAGVLLTGMGRDGAEGLLKLRRAGWPTFAQDRESSVVFGMPDAAAKLGAAVHVMPPDQIGRMVLARLRR